MTFVSAYIRTVRVFTPNARWFLAAGFLLGLAGTANWVITNLYLVEMGWTESEIGSFLGAASLGAVLLAPPAALWLDRTPLRPTLLLSCCLTGLGLLGQATCPDRTGVILSGFIGGAGNALLMVASGPFLMRNSSRRERTHLFGFSVAIGTAAGILTTLVMWQVTTRLGNTAETYRMILVGAAVLSFGAAGAFLCIRTAPAPPPAGRLLDSLRTAPWGTVARLCVPEFLIGCGAGLTIRYVNLYFHLRFDQGGNTISLFFLAAQCVSFVGFLSAPLLAQKMGLVRAVVGTQICSLPFLIVLGLSTNLPLAVGAFLMRNVLMNMAHPLVTNFSLEIVNKDQQAATTALMGTSWNVAWFLTAGIGGWLIEEVPFLIDGFTTVMFLTAGIYVAGCLSYYVMFRRYEDIGLELTSRVLAPGDPAAEPITETP